MTLEYNPKKGELRFNQERVRNSNHPWRLVCIGIDEKHSVMFFEYLNKKITQPNSWKAKRPSYEDVMFEFALFCLTRLNPINPN